MEKSKAGFSHIILLILIGVFVLAGIYYFASGNYKAPTASTGQKPTVTLQTKFQNPFDKNSQYANPFAQYKNPFEVAK